MMGDKNLAHIGGAEYEASLTNDPGVVNLWWDGGGEPPAGFVKFAPGEFKRSVNVADLDDLVAVEWFCEYRGEPFKVVAESDAGLTLSYLGGNIDKARELGLDIQDQLVAFGFAARDDVENLREVRTQLWPQVA